MTGILKVFEAVSTNVSCFGNYTTEDSKRNVPQ
jgi:hypothetical protein